MPRSARKRSESGFYHVIVRGIGKQIIFEEAPDYGRFLKTTKKYLGEHKIQLHAYCLMENHVHLLVRDTADELNAFMKKLEGSYAYYFNHKYERIGNLFQDRYKSEPVDDDAYFAVVLRYILNNPAKAGISTLEAYEWSSYRELTDSPAMIHSDFALDFFGSREAMMKFLHEPNSDICLEPSPAPVSDSSAKGIIHDCLHLESGTMLQLYDKKERDEALRILKDNGLSVRQIERLTGINRGAVLRA